MDHPQNWQRLVEENDRTSSAPLVNHHPTQEERLLGNRVCHLSLSHCTKGRWNQPELAIAQTSLETALRLESLRKGCFTLSTIEQ